MQLKSLEDTQNFSKNISKIISAGDIIFLYGEIGVGKTTFVRFFINYLESKNEIKTSFFIIKANLRNYYFCKAVLIRKL